MDTKKTKGETPGIRTNVAQPGHRSYCDQKLDYFFGTESKVGENPKRIIGCACGLECEWQDVRTGEVSPEKVS